MILTSLGSRAAGPKLSQFLKSNLRSNISVKAQPRYSDRMCAAGGNLATAQGWRAAVHAYNAPTQYEVHVTELANRYAAESLS